METLVKMVAEKTGISEDKARTAVETVVSFLKDKLPSGLALQMDSVLQNPGTNVGGLGDITGTLGDAFK